MPRRAACSRSPRSLRRHDRACRARRAGRSAASESTLTSNVRSSVSAGRSRNSSRAPAAALWISTSTGPSSLADGGKGRLDRRAVGDVDRLACAPATSRSKLCQPVGRPRQHRHLITPAREPTCQRSTVPRPHPGDDADLARFAHSVPTISQVSTAERRESRVTLPARVDCGSAPRPPGSPAHPRSSPRARAPRRAPRAR